MPKHLTITRRSLARRFGVEPEVIDRLEQLHLLEPIRRPGRERLYDQQGLEQVRVWRLLVSELEVNAAGAEIILRLRRRLVDAQRRVRRFLDQARAEGLLEEILPLLESLDDDFPEPR
ncbi:MAG TPA: chaperone modulator CbpM [Myxococcota bacterium]|nr:chaperone modulator CbpM [Myxococcota bacterium]HRY93900.1 chaperone modulator CbpM [Myxococcota bacterium]